MSPISLSSRTVCQTVMPNVHFQLFFLLNNMGTQRGYIQKSTSKMFSVPWGVQPTGWHADTAHTMARVNVTDDLLMSFQLTLMSVWSKSCARWWFTGCFYIYDSIDLTLPIFLCSYFYTTQDSHTPSCWDKTCFVIPTSKIQSFRLRFVVFVVNAVWKPFFCAFGSTRS